MTATVCIIDDDASVRRALRRLVSSAGHDVVVCGSAEEFLEGPDLPPPACLLLDVRMPGMTGIDLQGVLSGISPDIPIIMMSGHADAATKMRALSAGAVAFLCKPFEDAALLEAIERAIGLHPRTPAIRRLPIELGE